MASQAALSPAVELCTVRDAASWESCRAAFAEATIFHRWDWCRFAAGGLGFVFAPLGVVVDDRLAGLVPVLLRRRGPVATANWVPFPYLGPLLPRDAAGRALALIRRALRRRRVVVTQLSFAPGAEIDPTTVQGAGYEAIRDTTLVVPLADRAEADLWRGMKDNTRYGVQRARRLGLEVRPATREDVMYALPALVGAAYARHGGRSDYTVRALRHFWEVFHGREDVRMAALVRGSDTQAVSISLIDRGTGYVWLLASRRLPRVDTSCQLYWDAFTWARARGCATFDLLGTPTAGIADYKRRLGGMPRDHLVARRFESRLARRALEAYGRLRYSRDQA